MPVGAVETLVFQDWTRLPNVDDSLRRDVSCIAIFGKTVFLACDETASIEALVCRDGGYGDHRHIRLSDFFDLPDGPDGEMDIEGLSVSSGYLWIVGSHSLKRDKPERQEHSAKDALRRMLDIDRDANRYFLGCVPIAEDSDGGGARLVKKAGSRRAASLKLDSDKSKLLDWLEKDGHLAPFLDIPSKENGFDIEGICAHGDRIWLGLRGPVLRGHGVILELEMKRPKPSRLKARRIDDRKRYRKHVIDTNGLGVRDLCIDGSDMLILVGTPLASDGPARVLRWRNAIHHTQSGVVDSKHIVPLVEVPYGGDRDHPEGIDLLEGTGRRGPQLIVVYDSPAEERVGSNPASLAADLFSLDKTRLQPPT